MIRIKKFLLKAAVVAVIVYTIWCLLIGNLVTMNLLIYGVPFKEGP